MEFIKYLIRSEVCVKKDRRIFGDWMNGKITTNQAIEKFKRNNEVFIKINPIEFTQWLHSLGYVD